MMCVAEMSGISTFFDYIGFRIQSAECQERGDSGSTETANINNR